jgi:hypothetical protein
MSARVGRDELISTAIAAVSAGWRGAGPLPDHDVLLRDSTDAFQHGLEFAGLGPSGWQGIAYDAAGEDQDFVIAWRPGGTHAVQALHSLRPPARSATVGDREVLIAADGRGAAHATWSLPDGTVVQVASFGEIEGVLARVVEGLRPIQEEDFDALVAAHPPSPDGPTVDPPGGIHGPGEDGRSIASVSLAHAGATIRLDVHEDGPDQLITMLTIERGSGSSGSGAPLPDLNTPVLRADGESSGPGGDPLTPVIVSGVLPAGVAPDLAGVRVVDRTTGTDLAVVNWVTGTLEPGGDPRLVIMVVEADPGAARVDVTFPTPMVSAPGASEVRRSEAAARSVWCQPAVDSARRSACSSCTSASETSSSSPARTLSSL